MMQPEFSFWQDTYLPGYNQNKKCVNAVTHTQCQLMAKLQSGWWHIPLCQHEFSETWTYRSH